MLRTVLGISIVLISLNAAAEVYTMALPEKKIKIETQSHSGIEVTKSCFPKKSKVPKCDAYNALSEKVTVQKPDMPLAGHPAAFYCGSAGGHNRILKDSENNEYDFCEFKDGTMINSWNLYNRAKK